MIIDNVGDAKAIQEVLAGADIVTQALVLVQWSQDPSLLDEIRPHVSGPWDYMAHVPSEIAERVRTQLADRIVQFQKGELAAPPPPTLDLARAMMDAAVGQHVPDRYVPMLLEDIALQTADLQYRESTETLEVRAPEGFIVTVIGGGMSGIVAAIKLKQAGIPFRLIEKSDAIGGVWYQNTYPGCGVDTPNHFYTYSFARNHNWSHYFSKRDELFSYFKETAEEFALEEHIELNCEVTSAVYDETRAEWQVSVKRRDGIVEVLASNAVIFAVGALNRPAIPDIPGLESFSGTWCHTAEWNSELKIDNARVAIIGTGASAVQVAPAIAPNVQKLMIFQRSPQWLSPSPNYHREVTYGKKWALKNVPSYASWYRFQLFWGSADGNYAALEVDPSWENTRLSINSLNQSMREKLISHIRDEIGERVDLEHKVIPTYPPYGKRMLRDNRWFETLKRPNVDLITEGIARIESDAVVTNDGEKYPVDAIVFATGFRASEMLAPVAVTGRGGRDLRSEWGDDNPRAHLGITMPGFPNLFVLFGPNTVLAHGGSAIFQSECQVHYVVKALSALFEGGFTSVEVKQDAHDAYNERVDQQHSRMVWSHPGVGSWYKNKNGRVTVAQPWRMIDYWHWTREIDRDEYMWG